MIYLIGRGEIMHVDDRGRISRPSIMMPGSDKWTMTGAVEYRFGRPVRTYTLADVFAKRVPWFWKNGKQRCYVTDNDHGTKRIWGSPALVDVRIIS